MILLQIGLFLSYTSNVKSSVKFISYLRIVAAFSIILIHVASKLSPFYEQLPRAQWWAANIISSASHWAMPIFIMISGYLLLNPTKSNQTKKFYLQRIKRIGWPLFFWIIVYAFYNHFARHDPLTFDFVTKRFIFDQPYEHLYFLVVLIELALITPFLSKIINSISTRSLGWLTITFLFISVFWKPSRFIVPLFIPYIGYYLGAYWLKKRKFQLKSLYFWISTLVIIALMAIGTYLLFVHPLPNRDSLYFYTFFNPLIILLSFQIFIFLQNKEKSLVINKYINQISKTTFIVYLFHPILVSSLHLTKLSSNFIPTILLIMIEAILVFIISIAVATLYQWLIAKKNKQ